MTTLALYGGPTKRSIIQRAFGMCGQSTTEFALTPEEMALGLVCMNDVAATLGAIPFNLPASGDGYAEDESGLPAADVLGFTARLAQEIAPNIGKAYRPTGPQSTAMSTVLARYQTIAQMEMRRSTPRGSGNRLWAGQRPYFSTNISADEPTQ